MGDMLVNLLAISDGVEEIKVLEKQEDIKICRALAPDKHAVVQWVKKHSNIYASGECDVCFANTPVSCFIAVKGKEIIGYACYNAIAPNFFGPTKVIENQQGKGIGKALLLRCLRAMKDEGYHYGIIGCVGPKEFYRKTVNAVDIESSETVSVYNDFLKLDEE